MPSEDGALTIGFSPCPNDTFIFNGLVFGNVCSSELSFAPPVLEDVETLNEWASEERFDVTKLSFHALGHVLDKYVLLRAGSALGRGCGPLLVGPERVDPGSITAMKIAIPGRYTTAAMLLKLYAPTCGDLVPMRFDKIMPAIIEGRVDAGLIIHESRFTYQGYGLHEIIDLGRWWEESTGLPIPLGGIAARRSIGKERIKVIENCIRKSVEAAFDHPEITRDYIRSHAQEMDDQVIDQHISLYVNDYSVELGEAGEKAVNRFFELGVDSGLFPELSSQQSLFI